MHAPARLTSSPVPQLDYFLCFAFHCPHHRLLNHPSGSPLLSSLLYATHSAVYVSVYTKSSQGRPRIWMDGERERDRIREDLVFV